MYVYRQPSFIPYRRRRSALVARQQGGTGTATVSLSASSTGQKSAGSTSPAHVSLSGSGTGRKSTGATSSALLVLSGLGSGQKSTSGTGTAWLTLTAEGQTPPFLPFHDLLHPVIYTELQKPPYRFIAQNARTGEFLSWELPLLEPTIKLTLSGPSVISGKFNPETVNLKDSNGQPLLKSWGTLVHFEMGGQIRASGILMPSQYDGPEWTVDIQGFTTYPHEMPYWGDWPTDLQFNIDAIDVIQEIWGYLQSFPNGNLNVTVPRTVGALPTRLGATLDGSNNITPYAINWWDAKNCGSEIDSLAKAAPLDYVETCTWNGPRSAVDYELTIGYPRLGTTRTDLRFVQGENINSVVTLDEPDAFYASGVAGIGAGEGVASLRDIVEVDDPTRLRRIYTYRSKKQTSTTDLNRIIRDELASRMLDREIQKITVGSRHPNAIYGSYQVGDDILPMAEIKWWGWTRIWHRIVAITFTPEKDLVTLDLKRSSSFRYGQDAESS